MKVAIITIDTEVDLLYDALATLRAAYSEKMNESYACPTCGARGKESCRTRWGKRASKRHIYRRTIFA